MVILSSKSLLENLVFRKDVQVCGLLWPGRKQLFPPRFPPSSRPCLMSEARPRTVGSSLLWGSAPLLSSSRPLFNHLGCLHFVLRPPTPPPLQRGGGNAAQQRRPHKLGRKRRLLPNTCCNLSHSTLPRALLPVSLRRRPRQGAAFRGSCFCTGTLIKSAA